MTKSPKSGLGKGLSALFGDDIVETFNDDAEYIKFLDLGKIVSSTYQPRQHFVADTLHDLAQSIKDKGVLQPILVRRLLEDEDKFEIVAGERRFRAAQLANIKQIPCRVLEIDDRTAMEIAILENIQRDDLSILEEAESYRRLMDDFQYTQELLSEKIGKSRSYIANVLRLLHLPQNVKLMISRGELTAGHAKTLLTLDNVEDIAREIVARSLNVRDTEELVKRVKEVKKAEQEAQQYRISVKEQSTPQQTPDTQQQSARGKVHRSAAISAVSAEIAATTITTINSGDNDSGDGDGNSDNNSNKNSYDNDYGNSGNLVSDDLNSDHAINYDIFAVPFSSEKDIICEQISAILGLKVEMSLNKNKGVIKLHFANLQDLDSLLDRLAQLQTLAID